MFLLSIDISYILHDKWKNNMRKDATIIVIKLQLGIRLVLESFDVGLRYIYNIVFNVKCKHLYLRSLH